eukprot:g3848.t1
MCFHLNAYMLFQETMPQVVEQSHRDESKAWEQKFKQEQEEQDGPSEEENAPQEEEPRPGKDAGRLALPSSRPQLLELRELPEECCPLYVCKEDYIPQLPGRTNDEGVEHLLKLYKGDVVRVVSLIEDGQQWLQGYVDSMEQNKPRGAPSVVPPIWAQDGSQQRRWSDCVHAAQENGSRARRQSLRRVRPRWPTGPLPLQGHWDNSFRAALPNCQRCRDNFVHPSDASLPCTYRTNSPARLFALGSLFF